MITVGYSTRETKPEFIEYLKKSSGFNLGLINDPNMSLIIKAQDDDPNQLFSLR